MYVATWEEFSQRAKSLYLADPMRTRYCIRYDHSGSSLVVKVTDDVKVRRRGRGSPSACTHMQGCSPGGRASLRPQAARSMSQTQLTLACDHGERATAHRAVCASQASLLPQTLPAVPRRADDSAGAAQVLQFKTDQQADAKKLDELNAFFLSLMAGADPDDVSAAAPAQKSAAESGVLTKRPKRRN